MRPCLNTLFKIECCWFNLKAANVKIIWHINVTAANNQQARYGLHLGYTLTCIKLPFIKYIHETYRGLTGITEGFVPVNPLSTPCMIPVNPLLTPVKV